MSYTKEQETMLENTPSTTHKPARKVFNKRNTSIVLGVLAGGAAAYFIGPSILRKVQSIKG